MITWRRKRLEAKDGKYTCDGVEINKDKWHEIVSAQLRVQENVAVGYMASHVDLNALIKKWEKLRQLNAAYLECARDLREAITRRKDA